MLIQEAARAGEKAARFWSKIFTARLCPFVFLINCKNFHYLKKSCIMTRACKDIDIKSQNIDINLQNIDRNFIHIYGRIQILSQIVAQKSDIFFAFFEINFCKFLQIFQKFCKFLAFF